MYFSCMHAQMYKYTHRDPVPLLGEAQSLRWLIGVVWLPLFTSCYLCAEAGKINKLSVYMTQTRKTPWPTNQPAYSMSVIVLNMQYSGLSKPWSQKYEREHYLHHFWRACQSSQASKLANIEGLSNLYSVILFARDIQKRDPRKYNNDCLPDRHLSRPGKY